MKTHGILLITLLSMLTACMNPLPGDFKGEKKSGLTADQVHIAWRLSNSTSLREVLVPSAEDSQKTAKYVAPLFEQLIPRIFEDLKAKKITLYEYQGLGQPTEEVITDVAGRIASLNEKKPQNSLIPFSHSIHFTAVHQKEDIGFQAPFLQLMLVWYDTEEQLPERLLGILKMEEVNKLGYTIDLDGRSYPLEGYVRDFCTFKIFPVTFQITDYDMGIETLGEAFYLKDHLLAGKWDALSWVKNFNDELNYSGKEAIDLPTESINKFVGIYAFPSQDADADSSFLEIKFEEGYIKASWSEGYFHGLLYPASEQELFTRHGATISLMNDGKVGFKSADSMEAERFGVKLE
jgi:hypothetical protein